MSFLVWLGLEASCRLDALRRWRDQDDRNHWDDGG